MVNQSVFEKGIAWLALLISLGLTAACVQEGEAERIIHGPLEVPEGMYYDEWKEIPYSVDKSFSVVIEWALYSSGDDLSPVFLSDEEWTRLGYTQITKNQPADFRIVSVTAEPIGGEMQLRTGGYVDITLKVEMSSPFQYEYLMDSDAVSEGIQRDSYSKDFVRGIRWAYPSVFPFDRYTGISLLNTIYEDGAALHQAEASDTGFVESQVTYGRRTYRILTRSDDRNKGGFFWDREKEGNLCRVRIPSAAETIYTFRIPADYDGLSLAFPKASHVSAGKKETAASSDEVYVDILTGDDGRPLDPADYWFVRVSDLIEYFSGLEPEEEPDQENAFSWLDSYLNRTD